MIMFNKTTSAKITKYYQIFNELTDDSISTLDIIKKNIKHQSINRLYQYNKPIYIKCIKGIVLLALSKEDEAHIEYYVVHRVVKLNKNVMFNFVSLTKTSIVEMYIEPHAKRKVINLDNEYTIPRIKPSFDVNQVYAYYYQV